MKKLIYLFALIAIGFTSCGGGENAIVGNWQLDKVSTEELTDSEKEATMSINADGTFEQKRGDHSKTGTWELSEDGKTLSVKDSEGDVKSFSGVKVEGDAFSFSEGETVITFKRI